MAEVAFYHLTRTGLEDTLPRLLGRTLEAGERAVVRVGSAERLAVLDGALWLCAEPAWLPHGTAASGEADLQPIWLTTGEEVPNGARFLFLVDGAVGEDVGRFARVFDVFDGNDAMQVARARERWAAAKAAGHGLSYWQQTELGWEKKN